MKKLILITAFAIVLKTAGILPFQSSDVADLLPIRALTVDSSAGNITLDGGEASGQGKTLEAALTNLRETAVGDVFLETAKYIILSPRAADLLDEVAVWEALRPAARVVLASGDLPKADDAADYLAAHDPGLTLQQVRAYRLRGEEAALPILEDEEGGLRLVRREHE